MRKYLVPLLAFLLFVPTVYAAGAGRDLHHNIGIATVIPPQMTDNTNAIVGTIIDSNGYGAVEYAILTGAQGDNNATFTVLLEDCAVANCSDNAAVADAYLLGTEAAASWTTDAKANTVLLLGYSGNKRYTRMTVTPAANTGDNFFGVTAILGYPQVRPTR